MLKNNLFQANGHEKLATCTLARVRFNFNVLIFAYNVEIQEIEVKDPNVEPDAFRTMLHFIYKSYKDVSLSGDSVMPVLYVGMWVVNFEKLHSFGFD